jgi:cytochrome P450 family 110
VRLLTFSIIVSAIFGMEEDDARFKKLTDSLHALIQVLANPFAFMTLLNPLLRRNLGPLTPWVKIMKLKQAVDACLFEEIEARRKINLDDRTDILSLLLQAKDEAGHTMTNQEIRDEMLTLLMAGHETSTMGITWAFYGILSNPAVLQKLKEELNTVIQQPHEFVQKLDKLTYLDVVLKEALRITPVVPYVVRIVKETYQLGEYTLPEGASIMPCLYLTHRDPDVWHDPDKFIPERFLNTSETPYTYLPFGSGIRRCIGTAFAQYEMKIIIAQILLDTELVLQEGYVPKLERKGVVIAPSNGLPITIQNISNKV